MHMEYRENVFPSQLFRWLVEYVVKAVRAEGNTPMVRELLNLLAGKIRTIEEADYTIGELIFLRDALLAEISEGRDSGGSSQKLSASELVMRAAKKIANQRDYPCFIRLRFPHQTPRCRSSATG